MLEHARVRKHLADVTAESSSSATNGNGDRLEAQFRAGERFRQAIGKATWYFDDLGAMLREKVRDGN
jgi:hypothetical protein